MDNCKGTHPEVISEPRHQPVLEESSEAGVLNNKWPSNSNEGSHSYKADDDTRLLILRVLVQVKVPHSPVTNGCPQFQRSSQKGLVHPSVCWAPVFHVFTFHWMPSCVFYQLVCMSMMLVVLDSPWLEWIDQWHEHECSHNVLHKLVFGE